MPASPPAMLLLELPVTVRTPAGGELGGALREAACHLEGGALGCPLLDREREGVAGIRLGLLVRYECA